MLMIGRLMFGKRPIGNRPSAASTGSTMASAAIKTAIELRRARSVSHMLLPGLRAHLLPRADQLLALGDDQLLALQALHDLHQRALALAGGDREPADDTLVDDEHRRGVAVDRDRLAGYQQGSGVAVDHELHARVHARLEQELLVHDLHLDPEGARARVEGVDDAGR